MDVPAGLTPEELAALKAPFDPSVLKKRGDFDYIPITKIIDRLDTVFDGRWNHRVLHIWEGAARRPTVNIKEYKYDQSQGKKVPQWVEIDAHSVTAVVELEVISKTGTAIKRTAAGGACVELAGQSDGDAAKAAISSALAKAAWYLGVGLYLSEQAKRSGYSNQSGSSSSSSMNVIMPGVNTAPPIAAIETPPWASTNTTAAGSSKSSGTQKVTVRMP